jgi:CBS domain containing-hemolysin-like protein
LVDVIELIPLVAYFTIAISISFLCSLLEAVFLSVNQPYVEYLIKEGNRAGPILHDLKENTDRSLAAILSLNTIAHTLGAAGVGAEVLKLFGNAYVAIASVIMTLLILVFSEIIPKTIGAANWKRFSLFTARTIKILITILMPLVWLLEKISQSFRSEDSETTLTRGEMLAATRMGLRHGTLEEDEARIIRNLLKLDNILAREVMTPRTVMFTFRKDQTVGEVLQEHTIIRFSRIPIIDDGLDSIMGIVLRTDLMQYYTNGKFDMTMEELLLPVTSVAPDESVGKLLDDFIAQKEHIFIVVNEFGSTEGLISLEDTIETLLGVEIVDEDDSVADMQQLARELWKQKQKQIEGSDGKD